MVIVIYVWVLRGERVKESEKLILDPHPDPYQLQNFTTSVQYRSTSIRLRVRQSCHLSNSLVPMQYSTV